MLLPLPLLLGLLVVAANCELLPSLPGASSLTTLLAAAPLLAVPALLAAAALRAARNDTPAAWQRWLPPGSLLRLSMIATPVVVHAFWHASQFGDWLDRLSWDSHLGRVVLAMLPVYLAELPRVPIGTLAGSVIDVRTEMGAGVAIARGLQPVWADVAEFARMRLGGLLLVVMPLLLLGALLDLLQLDRRVYSFVVATAPGVLLGTLTFLLVAVAVLPSWFRVAFAVRPLPEPIGTRLRATAAKLGFPPQRLWLLPTGMRALNAMLVGPLPFGRCLCLTDGLVRELDADALAGVVAHEVGHAQRGHLAILVGLVVIALSLQLPMRTIDFDAWDVVVRSSAFVGATIAAWFVVRTLAHRFEHEADAASVAALGAAPCSRALQVVSRLAMPVEHGWFGRLFTLHPDEPSRWQRMRRYEGEPAFRTNFERQSRWLRLGVLGVLALALVLGALGSRFDWPYEQVIWRLSAGDHAAAMQSAQALGDDVPERWRRVWRYVREDLAVATAMAPTSTGPVGGNVGALPLRPDEGWRRGEDVLLASGPAAARPWFAMVLSAADEPTAVQRAVLGFCDASAEGDTARMAAIAAIVRELGVPPRLERVFMAP